MDQCWYVSWYCRHPAGKPHKQGGALVAEGLHRPLRPKEEEESQPSYTSYRKLLRLYRRRFVFRPAHACTPELPVPSACESLNSTVAPNTTHKLRCFRVLLQVSWSKHVLVATSRKIRNLFGKSCTNTCVYLIWCYICK